jgi:3-deoxy-manno-octulosonate cytidylyltransferase (CMP-KDO synthetase)
MAEVVAVIPARLNSKRFSGKVIRPYRGRPLLYYVWREATRSKQIDRLVIATDSTDVAAACATFGAEVLRTSRRHKTGSDRVAETAERLGGELYVNIQADNLGLRSDVLDRAIATMKRNRTITYATLARRIDNDDDLYNPDIVKVVMTEQGEALWFSRYPLPYLRQASEGEAVSRFPFHEHIGVYFYRRRALRAYARWPRTRLEKAESLEQLRILENGGVMRVFLTRARSVSVDSPQDLKKLDTLYS